MTTSNQSFISLFYSGARGKGFFSFFLPALIYLHLVVVAHLSQNDTSLTCIPQNPNCSAGLNNFMWAQFSSGNNTVQKDICKLSHFTINVACVDSIGLLSFDPEPINLYIWHAVTPSNLVSCQSSTSKNVCRSE